jgi:hypothetical protein
MGFADDLERLSKLYASGDLDKAQFEAAKSMVLSSNEFGPNQMLIDLVTLCIAVLVVYFIRRNGGHSDMRAEPRSQTRCRKPGRVLHCGGKHLKEFFYADEAWASQVDFFDGNDSAKLSLQLQSGSYTSVAVTDAFLDHELLDPSALQHFFAAGGNVVVLGWEGIYSLPDKLNVWFGCKWNFHSYTSDNHKRMGAAEGHFSAKVCSKSLGNRSLAIGKLDFYTKSNALTVPKEEAMWAAVSKPNEDYGIEPGDEGYSADPDAYILTYDGDGPRACEAGQGRVGGVSIAVHKGTGGGNLAWFGNAATGSGDDPTLIEDFHTQH